MRILILRPDNIGDVVLFSGALKHIRQLYPDAHITLAVQKHIVNLVELCPYIDVCVAISNVTWLDRINRTQIPFKTWLKKPVRILNKLWNTFKRPFDIIIYPLKSPQIYHLEVIDCLMAKQVFGITGCSINAPPNGYPLDLKLEALFTSYLDVSMADPWIHELLTTLQFLRFLGCDGLTPDDIKPEFWRSDEDRDVARRFLSIPRPIIGVFPSSSEKRKNWNPDNYSHWAQRISNPGSFVIFGGKADSDMALLVAAKLKKGRPDIPIINMTGKTNLRQLAACIANCDIMVSVDSVGLHLGIVANIPTVGIIGGWHYGRFAPWGNPERHKIVTNHLSCFGCNWKCSRPSHECLHLISPIDVASCCNELLLITYYSHLNRDTINIDR